MNIEKIKEIMSNADDFSGAVKISKKEKTLFEAAKGYSYRQEEIPNKIDTSFGIASGTKGFTALGILKLIDNGKLSLDDNVFDILPYDFPNVGETITVKHLLNHTSGIYDYFDEDEVEDFGQLFKVVPINKILSPSDMLPLLTTGESYFSPGKQYKYCNSGFVILGMLIEVVSGMKYSEYLEKEIIKPLGLNGTGCYKTNQLPKNSATGYIKNEDGTFSSNIFEIPMACTADGGLFTTVDDMQKFWNGFMGGKVISEDMKAEALKKQAKIEDDYYYGLGFYLILNDDYSVKYYALVGCDPGVSFLSRYYVKDDCVMTIISNTDYGAWDISKKITEYI